MKAQARGAGSGSTGAVEGLLQLTLIAHQEGKRRRLLGGDLHVRRSVLGLDQ